MTTATFEGSRTPKNVRAQPKVRAAIGTTGDVLMIDATATIATVADIADIAEVAERYAQASGNDPQSVPGFVYIQLVQVGGILPGMRAGRLGCLISLVEVMSGCVTATPRDCAE